MISAFTVHLTPESVTMLRRGIRPVLPSKSRATRVGYIASGTTFKGGSPSHDPATECAGDVGHLKQALSIDRKSIVLVRVFGIMQQNLAFYGV